MAVDIYGEDAPFHAPHCRIVCIVDRTAEEKALLALHQLNAQLEAAVAAQDARSRGAGATRTRARTAGGVWLLIHASCLEGADATAVVIEPAKASEVAPLIVDAYGLTPREVDVTRALARGLTTGEIARELHLSRYTVQDHLKSAFAKTGVRSRRALLARAKGA